MKLIRNTFILISVVSLILSIFVTMDMIVLTIISLGGVLWVDILEYHRKKRLGVE